jgi:hypothetical protein
VEVLVVLVPSLVEWVAHTAVVVVVGIPERLLVVMVVQGLFVLCGPETPVHSHQPA